MPVDSSSITVTRGVPFRQIGSSSLDLDIYQPTRESDRPAIVFLYGGEWRGGQKGQFARWAVEFADRGYVCLEPTYRLVDETTLRGMVADVKTALAWTRAHATELGIDPNRIAVAGHSAGAHLAVLAATTPDISATEPDGVESESTVAAAVGFSGVYDLRVGENESDTSGNDDEEYELIGGSETTRARRTAAVSPVTQVGPETPPTFLAHARDDDIIPVTESEAMESALVAADVPVETFYPDAGGHEFLFSTWHVEVVMSRTADFLEHRL